jgi:hypothetical protein
MAASIAGAPRLEHTRSPASRKVAELAAASGLFFAHYEHRVRLPSPQVWSEEPADGPSSFVAGVLAEPKYQAFRHDFLIASFHPGHRPKWTAHELCHGLIGFAYRPGAGLLFHALAAWLAELVPVALWYFFDEAGVRRCTHHQYGAPIFQATCDECETAALRGCRPLDRADRRLLADGRAFVERELAAVSRSRRLGRPRGTVHASIDLASDGLAYAAAHGPRLRAPEMERFVASFFGPQQGHHDSLGSLEARVVEVTRALTGTGKVRPWRASRWDYVAQDLGYRLLTLRASAPELARELDGLIDELAERRTAAGVKRTIGGYESLWAARGRKRRGLVPPAELFAVGYALPGGHGSSLRQLAEGVASACPNTWAALGRAQAETLREFAASERPERAPIGRRFARFLARAEPGPLAELASVEAAITHVRPRDAFAAQLDASEAMDERVMLASGVEILRIRHDVLGAEVAKLRKLRPDAQPRTLLVGRASASDVDVTELPETCVRRLERAGTRGVMRGALGLDTETIDGLLAQGLLVPGQYAC